MSFLPRHSAPVSGARSSPRDEAAAFEAAYDTHAREVYRAAYAVLRDAHLAEDVTHEVFIRWWRRPGAFDPARGELGPFLRVMARSQALDARRRTASVGRIQDRVESEGRFAAVASEDAHVVVERGHEATAVRSAVRRLPAAQREAVALAYWGGLTADEIARSSGAPLGTVKSRIRLGLRRVAREGTLAAA